MRAPVSIDHRIASIAAGQHGVVSRWQLLDAGLNRGHIARALKAGRLHRLHESVYAVGHRPDTDLARWMAATLACNGVLSHHSAGALHRLAVKDRGLTHVTASSDLRRPRIVVHRDRLETAERIEVHGVPVTRIARILIDLDRGLDDRAFDRLVRDAMYRRRFHDTRVRDALTRKRSSRRLGYLHDHNLIVEVDGWIAHGSRHALQRDRTTTNALQLAGYTVLRFTEQDLIDRPRTVATQTRRALAPTPAAASRAASSPHPGR